MAAQWKLSFRLSVIAVLLTLSSIRGVSLLPDSGNESRLDVTRLFSFEPNSTCRGEPPTQFETRSGEILNCSLDEYNAGFAVDGDPNTRWQSQPGDDPVALAFTLSETSTSLTPVLINLYVAHYAPQLLVVEVKARGFSEFSPVQAYVVNDQEGTCEQFDDLNIPCSNYSVGDPDISGNTNVTVLSCPLNVLMPIEEFRLLTYGFLPNLSPEAQYHTLAEVEIFANIAAGYFARSLHSIVTEGETGRYVDNGTQVEVRTDSAAFPGFSFRGYAQLEFSSNERVLVQWVFPSLPQTTNYRFIVRYRNLGNSRRLVGSVSQAGTSMNSRITFIREGNCMHPCFAVLENPATPQSPGPANFPLNSQDPVIITITLSSANILLDAIIVFPEEFYNPPNSSVIDNVRFIEECDISDGELRPESPLTSDFCIESAIQLSLDFFCATPACECQTPGSVGQECETYGGQCDCIEADVEQGFSAIHGRQCNLCPFYSYLTPDGCTSCSCPNLLDNCDLMTGQCSKCPPLVEGRSCNVCVANSFGDPGVGCTPCGCNETGSQGCNQVTGACICKTGVSGRSCELCMDGWFNFTSSGCANCDCDSVGSEGINCSDTGQCSCKTGVGGMRCSDCDDGFFAFSSAGCLMCNCSGRTSECQLDPASPMSDPQELCQCPFPHSGSSCERCMDGYFLSSLTGNCEICQCNGRADLCQDGTGECIDCIANTTGVDCGECLSGFFSADLGTDLQDWYCQPCPCITTTAYNISCQADVNGTPECFCRPGHNGPLCDSCSEGFFGSPPDMRCRSCNCSGNIDPDVPGSCDRGTGLCLICINNSTGPECEVCADDFYGNATGQNCQPCGCHMGGAIGSGCNSTGYCTCLIGVGGQRCDMCLPGYWNFTDGVGCALCMCAGGSISNDCNEVTGTCHCNEGVGEDDCSACLDGFFNFTSSGCTACECGIGATDSTCSPDEGRCTCQPGVMGVKCDQCEPYYTNLSSSGCQPCSECEQSLRTNLSSSENEQDHLTTDLLQLMLLQQANASGLEDVYMLIELLQENLTVTEQYLDIIEARLVILNSKASNFVDTINNSAERVSNASLTSVNLSPYAEDVHEHIVEVSNNVQEVQIDTGNVLRFATFVNQTVQGQLNLARIATTYALQVVGQHEGNYTMDINDATLAFREAQQVSNDAQNLHRIVQIQLVQSQNLSSDFQYLNDSLDVLLLQAGDLRDGKNNLQTQLSNITLITDQLELNMSVINHTVKFATEALGIAEQTVRQAEYALILVMEDIQMLEDLVGDLGINEGSTFISGSGVSRLESEALSPESMPDSLVGSIEWLRKTVMQLEGIFGECSGVIQQAMDHATRVSIQADQISSILSSSLTSGNEAVEAVIDYDESIAMIQEALNLTILANQTVNGTLVIINDLMTESLAATATMLLNTSLELLNEAERLYTIIRGLLPAVDEARQAYERAQNQTQQISNLAIMLSHDISELTRAISMNHDILSNFLNDIQQRLDTVHMIYEYVISVVPDLEQNITSSQLQLDQIQMTYLDVDSILESTNATAQDALDAFTNRTILLNDIDTLSTNNRRMLEALNNSIINLQQQLQRALQAAASIDLALRFYGNSSHNFSIPMENTSSPYSTTISMVFQPEDVRSGLILSTEVKEAKSGVALRLSNGSVQFEYLTASETVSLNVSGVREEEWYQLYASVDTNILAVSVAPLQSDGPSMMAIREVPSSLTPLSFSSEDVILLGGAQSLADTGSISSDGFSGCLDRVVVNSAQLSLLLPNEMDRDLATCLPRPPAELPRQLENGVWLQEPASFILANISSQLPSTAEPFEISFAFRTFTLDGILVYLTDFSTTHYVLVYYRNGRVVLDFSLTGLDIAQLSTTGVYNDGQWYDISVVLQGSSVTLTVGVEVLIMDALISSAFDPSDILSIGSPIQAVAVGGDVTAQQAAALQSTISEPLFSASGCFRNLQLSGVTINISESALIQQRVSHDGCPAEVSAGVRFMENGYAQFHSLIQSDETLNISISFRGSQLAATLLHLGTEPQVSLSVFHTRLRVDVESVGLLFVSQTAMLNNNQWHTVTLTFVPDPLNDNFTITELIIDGVRDSYLTEEFDVPVLSVGDPLLIGGTTEDFAIVVAERFRGCIGEVFINNRSLSFTETSKLVGVALYGCRPPSLVIPVPPPPPPLPPPPPSCPDTAVGLNGSDASFIALVISEEEVLRGFSVVLEFQTASSDAVLLYLQGSVYADFLALQLRGGILVFSYNLGSGRVDIESEVTYDDGEMHMVELRRFEQYGVMIIDDGVETRNGSSPGTFTALNINNGYLFLGGIPEFINYVGLFPGGEEQPPGLLACFYGLSINGVCESLTSTDIQAGMGLEPCISSYNNVAYFGANSYSRIFDNFYAGKRFTFSMDIRTHNCTGILLYVATPLYPDHFSLELIDGRLWFVFDNGPGEVMVEYIPDSDPMELCDGQWHSLTVEKDGETGYLTVDGGTRLSVTSQFSRFLAINTNDPLYVGGVPDSVRLRFTVQNGSFQGCINNLSLSQDGRDPQSIPLFQSTDTQNVNLYVCRL